MRLLPATAATELVRFVRTRPRAIASRVVLAARRGDRDDRGMPQFPERLVEHLGDQAPLSLWTAGNPTLLGLVDSHQSGSVALAASVAGDASVADSTLRLVRRLAEAGVVFVGGFHSPLERLCLGQLAKAGWPVIVFLGRTLIETGFLLTAAMKRPETVNHR